MNNTHRTIFEKSWSPFSDNTVMKDALAWLTAHRINYGWTPGDAGIPRSMRTILVEFDNIEDVLAFTLIFGELIWSTGP